MRPGRKSKTKRFSGSNRHSATELDEGLLLACALTRATRPEDEAAAELKADIDRPARRPIEELYIDRGYLKSPVVAEVFSGGGDVSCRPWPVGNGPLFSKGELRLDMRARTLTCPGGRDGVIPPGDGRGVCAGSVCHVSVAGALYAGRAGRGCASGWRWSTGCPTWDKGQRKNLTVESEEVGRDCPASVRSFKRLVQFSRKPLSSVAPSRSHR